MCTCWYWSKRCLSTLLWYFVHVHNAPAKNAFRKWPNPRNNFSLLIFLKYFCDFFIHVFIPFHSHYFFHPFSLYPHVCTWSIYRHWCSPFCFSLFGFGSPEALFQSLRRTPSQHRTHRKPSTKNFLLFSSFFFFFFLFSFFLLFFSLESKDGHHLDDFSNILVWLFFSAGIGNSHPVGVRATIPVQRVGADKVPKHPHLRRSRHSRESFYRTVIENSSLLHGVSIRGHLKMTSVRE